MFSPEQIKLLQAKLDPSHVAQRSQSGRTLDYIEGWFAISEANRIFGFDAWNRETTQLVEVRRDQVNDKYGKPQWRVGYMAKVRISVGDVVREGTGFGSGAMADLGEAIESAIKEAETDAMKRALMTFGNPFGLALYDKSRANVGAASEPIEVPVKSSAQLKRENSWDQVRDEISNDLADCHSTVSIDKCGEEWAKKCTQMGWPPAWKSAAKELFDHAREAIKPIQNMSAG